MKEVKPYTDLKQAVKNSRDHNSDWEISSNGMSLQVSHYVEYMGRPCICLTCDDHIETSYTMESGNLIFQPKERDTKSEGLLKAVDGLTTIFQKSKVPHVIKTGMNNSFEKIRNKKLLRSYLKKTWIL